MSEQKDSLHKEFELERMILFSDAVFAIAITLLIIEIKFPELPEGYRDHLELWKMFKPTMGHFFSFLLSFFFIGMSWTRHLRMFRYLRAYDDGVIFLNLASLFFIVAFPFSASGFTHITPHFMFPMVIYAANAMLIFLSNFLLSHYIFKRRAHLSVPGYEAEKKYIYLQNLISAIMMGLLFLVVVVNSMIFGYEENTLTISVAIVAILSGAMRKWLRKFKPAKV
jgi:uncharacterized membrane protein